jgi:hypothetical protein
VRIDFDGVTSSQTFQQTVSASGRATVSLIQSTSTTVAPGSHTVNVKCSQSGSLPMSLNNVATLITYNVQ